MAAPLVCRVAPGDGGAVGSLHEAGRRERAIEEAKVVDIYQWAAPIGLGVMVLYIAIGALLFQGQEFQRPIEPPPGDNY